MQNPAFNLYLTKNKNPYLLLAEGLNIDLENIIEGILGKEDQALEALYELTLARVYGLALKITNNKALAEEAVVDTYWQVWRDAQKFNADKGPLIAWLLVICRSRAIDAVRTHAGQHTLNADDADLALDIELHAEQSFEPDNQLQQSQSNALLHQYMNELSSVQKQLIHLAYFRGLTHEEISKQMHMPLGSVKSNIKRAQATLKKQLTQLDKI